MEHVYVYYIFKTPDARMAWYLQSNETTYLKRTQLPHTLHKSLIAAIARGLLLRLLLFWAFCLRLPASCTRNKPKTLLGSGLASWDFRRWLLRRPPCERGRHHGSDCIESTK